jgi:membrane protein implicated in regulation of membrane protease activity
METTMPANLTFLHVLYRITTTEKRYFRKVRKMPNEAANVLFIDNWGWLIAVGAGLVLIMLELFMGIDTGLDLVFIGTAFILGGLITLVFKSWVWTALISGIICLLYVFLGRRYIHRRTAIKAEKTNIDTIIGKSGLVQQDIVPPKDGIVKVGNEQWRARAEENIKAGEGIIVTGIAGVTLSVKKAEGGNG